MEPLITNKQGEHIDDHDQFFKDVIELIFSGKIPKFLFYPFQEIFGMAALLAASYPIGGCASALQTEPANDYLLKYIENEKYDLIISDPLDLVGPLLSWRYDIALTYNSRWTWTGDAGQALTGDHPSLVMHGVSPRIETTNRLTFYDRFRNVIHGAVYFAVGKVLGVYINPALEAWNYPHSYDHLIISQADLWLLRFNFLFEVPRPLMPNQLAVGAFKCKHGSNVW